MVVPDDGYLSEAHKLLQKHNALLIADEVSECEFSAHGKLSSCQEAVSPWNQSCTHCTTTAPAGRLLRNAACTARKYSLSLLK